MANQIYPSYVKFAAKNYFKEKQMKTRTLNFKVSVTQSDLWKEQEIKDLIVSALVQSGNLEDAKVTVIRKKKESSISAVTGKYVSKKVAKKNPKTTVTRRRR